MLRIFAMFFLLLLSACDDNSSTADASKSSPIDAARLSDDSNGNDWPAYGRTYGEQHYSPLKQITADNVNRLGLAWSLDLDKGSAVTIPVEVDGILYFASGLSVVHAVDAASGKLLWIYDPDVPKFAGRKLRQGWGSRGIGYWNGKVYTGTGDGRLIAIDAKTGKPIWTVMTVSKDDGLYITGAPRLFAGKVIIGHGGADSSASRNYVTTYDAETGKQLWRFFIVPGNPADGFEDKAQEMAAKTWAGEWWKYGGGGAVWNAFTYDAETQTIFLGTGNGAPWNRRIRSADQGDNLFLCSIVALDADTGKYKWHYQINPGEAWDYNASMDMHLADITIDGAPRKVLLQAPKNGFLYVIDRVSGRLISAEKIAKVTWATEINLTTGRPVEVPGLRYPDGKDFEIWPGVIGAHSSMPSAFSPQSGLMYIPLIEKGAIFNDRGISAENWKRTPGFGDDFAANLSFDVKDPLDATGWLLAIDPATQQTKWKLKLSAMAAGGLMATAGNLVFQGETNEKFEAYAADTGAKLWTYNAQAPVLAAPITYSIKGKQYVTVLAGLGTSAGINRKWLATDVDSHTQAKRVLTFVLDAKETLPESPPVKLSAPNDPDYRPNPQLEMQGAMTYGHHCLACHGYDAESGGHAPDLRTSAIPLSVDAFESVLHEGALVENGMPKFEEFDAATLAAIRQYIRSRANDLRQGKNASGLSTGGK